MSVTTRTRSGRLQAEEQHPGVGLSRPVDQFAEVLVHRHDEPPFGHRPRQNVRVGHGGVTVADEGDVVAERLDRVRHGPAGAHIDQDVHLIPNLVDQFRPPMGEEADHDPIPR